MVLRGKWPSTRYVCPLVNRTREPSLRGSGSGEYRLVLCYVRSKFGLLTVLALDGQWKDAIERVLIASPIVRVA
ncbi:hypothetical protein C8R42DRAFT_221137 [Lentinula raphanica]|nr:hypothetical protein C8R42DRAFT_221137 [Lentinula raphanica]